MRDVSLSLLLSCYLQVSRLDVKPNQTKHDLTTVLSNPKTLLVYRRTSDNSKFSSHSQRSLSSFSILLATLTLTARVVCSSVGKALAEAQSSGEKFSLSLCGRVLEQHNVGSASVLRTFKHDALPKERIEKKKFVNTKVLCQFDMKIAKQIADIEKLEVWV